MSSGKFFKRLRERRLSIRTKLILSLSSIAAILLVSLLICVIGIAVAIAAACLSHLVRKAADLQEQSDFTV